MIDILKNYAEGRLNLLKMEATEKVSLTIGGVVLALILCGLALFFLILISIGLAVLIGYYVENMAYGFLIMGGVYFLCFILSLVFKKALKEGVANIVIRMING
ncbi:phage holin family protein [Riemerella columbina]|uniref:phage holin family protein n=1 Tax=Riemerella columbina TaxID=103810 RepID=UPI00266FF8CB|nr:phage holin family protein [Riemerella columbina]WKS94608.1 phage holin family protein [Riemerella columbina]